MVPLLLLLLMLVLPQTIFVAVSSRLFVPIIIIIIVQQWKDTWSGSVPLAHILLGEGSPNVFGGGREYYFIFVFTLYGLFIFEHYYGRRIE